MWGNKKSHTPQAVDPQIIIEDGAYFKGSIEIDRAADKETDNNVSPGTTFRPTTSAAGAGPKSIYSRRNAYGGADRDARRQVTEGTSCFAALCRTTTARLRIVERSRRLACPNMSK